MDGHTCYHCKTWVPAGAAHDCWTTTEAALTRDLPDDLLEAWERLREAVQEFGEQRIYASHKSIMFARSVCYAFVRPGPKRLELCIFLGRTVKGPAVKRATPTSRVKVAHLVHITHRDQVEAPVTDWLREAFEVCEGLRTAKPAGARAATRAAKKTATRPARAAAKAKRPVATARKRPAGKTASRGRTKSRG